LSYERERKRNAHVRRRDYVDEKSNASFTRRPLVTYFSYFSKYRVLGLSSGLEEIFFFVVNSDVPGTACGFREAEKSRHVVSTTYIYIYYA